MRLLIVFLMIFTSALIYGDTKFPETRSPRVMFLFPEYLIIPAIEPALPPYFKAYQPRNYSAPYTYWGKTNSINTYLMMDVLKTDDPIFSIRISENTLQSALDEESVRRLVKEYIEKLSFPLKGEENPVVAKNKSIRFMNWGSYPVVALENTLGDVTVMSAWVGLNQPTEEVLLINYLFPNTKSHPTAKEREIWETFLTQTKELPAQYQYITQGQDLHPGYTVVALGPSKFRVLAEIRTRDTSALCAIMPLNGDTQFEFKGVQEGTLTGEWNAGAKILKIHGTITSKNYVFDHVTTVMVKEVDEFTIEPEELKKNPMNVVFDGKQAS